jgi:renalase
MTQRVLVIGAGMAGLRVAALRAAAGDTVTVVDKGRRHGGRMATRRVDEATFDTGVLDFAAHGTELLERLLQWSAAGDVSRTGDRWRGRPTMRSLPTALAVRSGATVELASRVSALAVQGGRWEVTVVTGGTARTIGADALVMTAPAPQAHALLSGTPPLASEDTLARLESVTFEPSLTVLVRPADRSLPPEALTRPAPDGLADTDLVRSHRNDTTGASAVVALTLQASARFSAAHLDGGLDDAARELAAQAALLVGTALEVVHVHGWRYAQVSRGIALPALRDDTSGAPLVLAGDAFTGTGSAEGDAQAEGVERALVSGGAAARLLDTGSAVAP